jgi:hypothetical protein
MEHAMKCNVIDSSDNCGGQSSTAASAPTVSATFGTTETCATPTSTHCCDSGLAVAAAGASLVDMSTSYDASSCQLKPKVELAI